MFVNLDKQDILTMIKGSYVTYNLFDNILIKRHLKYYDQTGKQEWSDLDNYDIKVLYCLYLIIKRKSFEYNNIDISKVHTDILDAFIKTLNEE